MAKSKKKGKITPETEEFAKIVQEVAKTFAWSFKFGIYEEDDLVQECYIIAVKIFPKYDASRGTLKQFLYRSLLNRLKNFRRDNFCRNNPPCDTCYRGNFCDGDAPCIAYLEWKHFTDMKMSIESPFSLNQLTEDFLQRQNILPCANSQKQLDNIDLLDTVKKITANLDKDLLEDFNILYMGGKLSNSKRSALLIAIHNIIYEDDVNE